MKFDAFNQNQDRITNYMYLGLLPFFAFALGPWVFADFEYLLVDLFFFYSTIILVFLAGALWAISLFGEVEFRQRHINMAIVFSLWPLVSFFLPTLYGVLLMMAGFLSLLFWEKCFINAIYPSWYQQLRHKITFIVVACHMLTAWNIIRV